MVKVRGFLDSLVSRRGRRGGGGGFPASHLLCDFRRHVFCVSVLIT